MSGSRSLHRRRNFKDRPGTKRRGAFPGVAGQALGNGGDRFSSVSQFSLKVRGLRIGCSARFAPTTDFFTKDDGYERKSISPSSKEFQGSPRN